MREFPWIVVVLRRIVVGFAFQLSTLAADSSRGANGGRTVLHNQRTLNTWAMYQTCYIALSQNIFLSTSTKLEQYLVFNIVINIYIVSLSRRCQFSIHCSYNGTEPSFLYRASLFPERNSRVDTVLVFSLISKSSWGEIWHHVNYALILFELFYNCILFHHHSHQIILTIMFSIKIDWTDVYLQKKRKL